MKLLQIAVLGAIAIGWSTTGVLASTFKLGFGPQVGITGWVKVDARTLSPTGDGIAYSADHFFELSGSTICPTCRVDSVGGGEFELVGFVPKRWDFFADSLNNRGVGSIILLRGDINSNLISWFEMEYGNLTETTINSSPWTLISPVPVPAALPLLASGLGALGFIGWRRKRKAAALGKTDSLAVEAGWG